MEKGRGEQRARQAWCGERQSAELEERQWGGEKATVSETLQGLELTELGHDCG